MSFDFSKFDENIDLEEVQSEIKNARESSEGSGEYEEVPHGNYEVKVRKLELVETKKAPARPMVSAWLQILEGEHQGSYIFMNQVITHPFSISIAIDFLESLLPDSEIEFNGYADFSNVILDVYEAIESEYEYGLEYGQNDKGFDTFKILEVYEA